MRRIKIFVVAATLCMSMAVSAGCGKAEEATDTLADAVTASADRMAGAVEGSVVMDDAAGTSTAVASLGTAKPDGTPKPSETAKSSGTAKPAETASPPGTAKPDGAQKPSETAKPSGTAKPAETASPTETAKPDGTPKPAGTAESVETAGPTGTAKPAETASPSGTAKPAETAGPSGTAKPVGSTQPSSTSCVHGDWSGGYEVTDLGNCRSHVHGERICGKCGYREVLEDYDTESHAFTTPVVVAGNCTQEGYQYHVCAKCGAQGDTISMGTDPNAHDYVQTGSSVVEPGDCMTAEILEITYTCSRCGDSYSKWEQGSTDPGNHNNVRDDGTCVCGAVIFIPEPEPAPEPAPDPVPDPVPEPAPDPVPEPAPESAPDPVSGQ